VVRGGGYIPFIGYIVAEREYVEQNPETVTAFLAARAQADRWMRQNPDQAADVAVRWVPGTERPVAQDVDGGYAFWRRQSGDSEDDERVSAHSFISRKMMRVSRKPLQRNAFGNN
jgi:ABC-type nitrate/sulfonate/bicarbonate transport system substrate-binding protein